MLAIMGSHHYSLPPGETSVITRFSVPQCPGDSIFANHNAVDRQVLR